MAKASALELMIAETAKRPVLLEQTCFSGDVRVTGRAGEKSFHLIVLDAVSWGSGHDVFMMVADRLCDLNAGILYWDCPCFMTVAP